MQLACASILFAAITIAVAAPPTNEDKPPKDQQPHGSDDWWKTGVFYQIYPRSFKDSNDDGIGDIKGIIEKLDYLKELGVTATWLSPVFASPQKDYGYDISNFTQIDKMFGTNDDLQELFNKAKEKDIKIILDFVPNHSSDEHEWFQKSLKGEKPYDEYYIWRDGKNGKDDDKNPPNNWISVFGGSAWEYKSERKQWYYHNFLKEQPDLNYRNEKVIEEMKNVLEFWLEMGAGGFRIDAINHLFEDLNFTDEPLSNRTNDKDSTDYLDHIYTKDLPESINMVYEFRKFVDEYKKNKGGDARILMTEAYTSSTEYPKYFKSEKGELGAQMPFNFVLIEYLNKDSSANEFKKVIDDRIKSVPNDTILNWVVGNHDQPRISTRFGEEKAESMIILGMTLPGIAVTYYGEEIGMLDHRKIPLDERKDLKDSKYYDTLSRDPERTPFQWDNSTFAGFMSINAKTKPWLPIQPNYRDLNVQIENSIQYSTLKTYKKLMELRKEHAFMHGTFNSTVSNNVFAYIRSMESMENEQYVVLINLGAREETVDMAKLFPEFKGTAKFVAGGFNTFYTTDQDIDKEKVFLRRYEAVVLKSAVDLKSAAATNVASMLALMFVLIARFIF